MGDCIDEGDHRYFEALIARDHAQGAEDTQHTDDLDEVDVQAAEDDRDKLFEMRLGIRSSKRHRVKEGKTYRKDHDDEVHDVPRYSQVRFWTVHNEAI